MYEIQVSDLGCDFQNAPFLLLTDGLCCNSNNSNNNNNGLDRFIWFRSCFCVSTEHTHTTIYPIDRGQQMHQKFPWAFNIYIDNKIVVLQIKCYLCACYFGSDFSWIFLFYPFFFCDIFQRKWPLFCSFRFPSLVIILFIALIHLFQFFYLLFSKERMKYALSVLFKCRFCCSLPVPAVNGEW